MRPARSDVVAKFVQDLAGGSGLSAPVIFAALSMLCFNPTSHGALTLGGESSIAFETNLGQAATAARYVARTEHGRFFFLDSGVAVSLPGTLQKKEGTPARRTDGIFIHFAGGNGQAAYAPAKPLKAHTNYYKGRNPDGWLHR
ncbi:MAG: hypothetical protein HYZ00_00255, partial [Candidatus Hydrogenedentes bacterium]|nr:hypothetical protein [Candidatus Hydrogenedentota bacterium]